MPTLLSIFVDIHKKDFQAQEKPPVLQKEHLAFNHEISSSLFSKGGGEGGSVGGHFGLPSSKKLLFLISSLS